MNWSIWFSTETPSQVADTRALLARLFIHAARIQYTPMSSIQEQ